MKKKISLIVKRGKDPDCVHYERINSEKIGICIWCGQVKDYNRIEELDDKKLGWRTPILEEK